MLFAGEHDYDQQIAAAHQRYGVPANLIRAVIAIESQYHPHATRDEPQIQDASRGLMQVLYRTAQSLGYLGAPDGLYDPATNVDLGTHLLADNLARAGGDVAIALSAYNAGWSPNRPNDAKRNADGSLVNQAYVDRVQRYLEYFATGTLPGTTTAGGLALLAAVSWWALHAVQGRAS